MKNEDEKKEEGEEKYNDETSDEEIMKADILEETSDEENGQNCRGCGCFLLDGTECVLPESSKAYCSGCFEGLEEKEEVVEEVNEEVKEEENEEIKKNEESKKFSGCCN